MEKLLTVKELAVFLGVTPTCVYRWLGENRLPVVRFSKRCVRFRESDIQELVEGLKCSESVNHLPVLADSGQTRPQPVGMRRSRSQSPART
jgi:excisionase family DNA binding protein